MITGRAVLENNNDNLEIGIWDSHSADHAASIVKKGLSKIWGWAEAFGNFSASIIGIIFIYKAVKYILSAIFNAIAIHSATGCSGLWSAATHLVVSRHNSHRYQQAPPPASAPRSPDGKDSSPTALQCANRLTAAGRPDDPTTERTYQSTGR